MCPYCDEEVKYAERFQCKFAAMGVLGIKFLVMVAESSITSANKNSAVHYPI